MEGEARSLKSQMRRADKFKASSVLIVGEDELAKGKAVLRDMASKRQDEISLDRVEAELIGEEGELMATERVFSDQWGDWKRSCYCGEPRAAAVGKELTLIGWVHSGATTAGLFLSTCATAAASAKLFFDPEVDAVAS